MKSQLKGSRELRARLKAVRESFKPMGREWAEETRDNARQLTRSHRRSGKLDRSFRVRASLRKAGVYSRFTGVFLNSGTTPHVIRARRSPSLIFTAGGRTIFAKRVAHRGQPATRFAWKAARAAFREHTLRDTLITAWNRAA